MQKNPLCLLILLVFWCALAQAQNLPVLSSENLQNGTAFELDKLDWKYTPNDDPRFADPQFDDSAWETLNGTAITLDNIPKSGWHGLGWFRLRLQVDPALANQPLALVMVHYGASEIYLDGKLVQSFGTVGATPETEVAYNPNTLPLGIVLDGRSEHVIAVRHSCGLMRNLTSGWGKWFARLSQSVAFHVFVDNPTADYGASFGLVLSESNAAFAQYVTTKWDANLALLSATLTLTLGFIFLLLYWFYSDQRANLYFGFAAIIIAVNFTINYLQPSLSPLISRSITCYGSVIMGAQKFRCYFRYFLL